MAPTMAEVMQDKGITRYRLSKESGVPWATLSDIYNGKTKLEKCEAGTVRKLASALDMTVEEVLDLETGIITTNIIGKPLNPEYLEMDLPPYVQKSIDDLKQGIEGKSTIPIDLLLDDLYGSINSAFWDNEISKEQAEYLRSKYLGI